jgi:hypothetical protein
LNRGDLEEIPPKACPGPDPGLQTFGGARDQEEWKPVLRPITRQFKNFDHVYEYGLIQSKLIVI